MAVSLPKTSADFSDPNYWKKFFAVHKSPFEWYGDYESLSLVLDKYLKSSDDILQIGCGNSQLASQLHDVGYRNILSIDTNSAVIAEQKARNLRRSQLSFEVQSATATGLEAESKSAVLDKGTLDALLPPDADEKTMGVVRDMFKEVTRVLRPGGRYIVVTLAQPHIIGEWLRYFQSTGLFLLRLHKLENKATGFQMPVFVLVSTKLRERLKSEMPIDFSRSTTGKPSRVTSAAEVLEQIESEQELSRFVHLCSKTLQDEVSIVIHSQICPDQPRFKLFIVDDPEVPSIKSYAVFVVPIGRDGDWLFATAKGRRSLRAQCKQDRLAIVTLFRDSTYTSLQDIKDELAGFVMRLNPVQTEEGKLSGVQFLTMGDHDVKRTVATGESKINGRWSVEDVIIRERDYRRLVFIASQNLVQSEAAIRVSKKNKRIIALDELACDHHEMMLLALALLPDSPLLRPETADIRLAVLGLGGGLLAAFLLRQLPMANVTGVELDPEVVKIAVSHFSFPSSDKRMQVKVVDALDYLEETAKPDSPKLDVLFVDLASAMSPEGLSCPPPAFLTSQALANMHDSLADGGVLALNLVTRDGEVSAEAKKKVAEHFPSLFVVTSEEDVNEVLIAAKKIPEKFDTSKFAKALNKEKRWLADVADKLDKLNII